MRWVLSAWMAIFVFGCGRLQFTHEPVFHTPLVEQTRFNKKTPKPSKKRPNLSGIRARALRVAETLVHENEQKDDFGESDVMRLLKSVQSTLPWKAQDGVPALARQAQIRRAFNADGRPLPGDIVLFHNQFDRNRNFENDDWHTGCGIVIDAKRDRFIAIIRTGHRPRKVVVSSSYPSIKEKHGETVNSFVRIPTPSDPENTEYLAGQLYAGHIDLEKMPSR